MGTHFEGFYACPLSNLFPGMFPTLSEDEKRRARRHSTQRTVSRYLGPSRGSCHDFCKYRNKETWPDIRSVTSYGRATMKLSSGRGSHGESPSIGFIKDKHKTNRKNLAAGERKKASSSRQPKSTMRSYPASSPGALKPNCTRSAPRVPSETRALPPMIKPIMTVRTKKPIGPSINSAMASKAQRKSKAAKSGHKKDVQAEELYSNAGKVENGMESTGSLNTPSLSNLQENESSNKISDFTEADDVDAEDEAHMNRSAEDTYRAGNINLERKKVNGIRSLIPSPRRLKFRSHPDDNKQEDSGYLSDPKSMKVALRHCQLQEKKTTRRSLNDIIEKTAVKLGRTQKSKVKALVGAFERIISLNFTT